MAGAPAAHKGGQGRHIEANVIVGAGEFVQAIEKGCNRPPELLLLRGHGCPIKIDKIIARQQGQDRIVDRLCFPR